jgi:hypothetical protein
MFIENNLKVPDNNALKAGTVEDLGQYDCLRGDYQDSSLSERMRPAWMPQRPRLSQIPNLA